MYIALARTEEILLTIIRYAYRTLFRFFASTTW
jgi:hypothetical protein